MLSNVAGESAARGGKEGGELASAWDLCWGGCFYPLQWQQFGLSAHKLACLLLQASVVLVRRKKTVCCPLARGRILLELRHAFAPIPEH